MALLRVLRTAKATLSRTFYLDETATDATGSVTVTVTRLDGTSVESGTASGPVSNVYTYTFGGRDVLDELLLTWSATVAGDAIILDQDRIQVVGGFFFSLAEGRASDPALTNTTKFPSAALIEKRVEVETECERICNQSFVPRFHREYIDGTFRPAITLSKPWVRSIRSVSTLHPGGSWVAFTASEIARLGFSDTGALRADGGVIGGVRYWEQGRRNILVEYEHGLDYPPPDIARAAKIRFKSMLLQPRSPVPDRAANDLSFSLARSDMEHTGLPEVDAAYARHPSPIPGFG